MELDPLASTLNLIRFKSLKDIELVCVDNHKVPKTCSDVCDLADAGCRRSTRRSRPSRRIDRYLQVCALRVA